MADDLMPSCVSCLELYDDNRHRPLIVCRNAHCLCQACFETLDAAGVRMRLCPFCRSPLLSNGNVQPNRLVLDLIAAMNRAHTSRAASLYQIPVNEIFLQSELPIGFGATADVYLGVYSEHVVAIKKLRIHSGPAVVAGMNKEAQLHSTLNHPNILQMFGHTTVQGCPALVLEFCDGGSLQQAIANAPRPAPQILYQWALDIANALQYLHFRLIAHRDIKPGNVLLCSNGDRAKLGDFGIARALATRNEHTRAAGTPGYIAPELLRQQTVYGPAVDIYSYSILLCELFSWAPAFTGLSVEQVIGLTLSGQRPRLPFDFPVQLAPMVGRGWSVQAIQRPRAGDFIDVILILIRQGVVQIPSPTYREYDSVVNEAAMQRQYVAFTPGHPYRVGVHDHHHENPLLETHEMVRTRLPEEDDYKKDMESNSGMYIFYGVLTLIYIAISFSYTGILVLSGGRFCGDIDLGWFFFGTLTARFLWFATRVASFFGVGVHVCCPSRLFCMCSPHHLGLWETRETVYVYTANGATACDILFDATALYLFSVYANNCTDRGAFLGLLIVNILPLAYWVVILCGWFLFACIEKISGS